MSDNISKHKTLYIHIFLMISRFTFKKGSFVTVYYEITKYIKKQLQNMMMMYYP